MPGGEILDFFHLKSVWILLSIVLAHKYSIYDIIQVTLLRGKYYTGGHGCQMIAYHMICAQI